MKERNRRQTIILKYRITCYVEEFIIRNKRKKIYFKKVGRG